MVALNRYQQRAMMREDAATAPPTPSQTARTPVLPPLRSLRVRPTNPTLRRPKRGWPIP